MLSRAIVLFDVHVDEHGITSFTTNNSVDPTHHEIVHGKGGKSGLFQMGILAHKLTGVKIWPWLRNCGFMLSK